MFSHRLDWTSAPNPLLELRNAKLADQRTLIDLTESNPTVVGFDPRGLDLATALAHPQVTVHRPSPQGDPGARAAIAQYYRDQGRSLDPDSVFLTASTSEAYSFLFRLLCDPGDEVLVPRPGYPLFDFLAALDLAKPVAYPLRRRERWQLHLEHLEATVGPRTRAIVVVSPHNPTGHCLTLDERDALVALCARHELALIVDEVFLDFVDRPPARWAGTLAGEERVLTFVLSGLSKVVAVPQVKLGWIQISGPPALAHDAARRLEFVADTYLSVSAAAQLATAPLLARRASMQEQIRARVAENLALSVAACGEQGRARVIEREGGWYAMLQLDGIDAGRFAWELLEHDDVFVHPGYFYDLDDETLLVLSAIVAPDRMRAGLERVLARARR